MELHNNWDILKRRKCFTNYYSGCNEPIFVLPKIGLGPQNDTETIIKKIASEASENFSE